MKMLIANCYNKEKKNKMKKKLVTLLNMQLQSSKIQKNLLYKIKNLKIATI